MWAKIGQWALQALLIPWLKDQGVTLVKWIKNAWKEYKRKKKLKKDNKKKVTDYENSTNQSDAHDSFEQLP